MTTHIHTGHCLCGGVRYQLRGPLRNVTACHCGQCRQTSGHHVAMTEAANADLTLTASDTLRWYRSSTFAERGFCGNCGGNLFWRQLDGEFTSVTAGTLDLPTGIVIDCHIFVASKADYYTIEGTAPQFPAATLPPVTQDDS